MGVVSRGTGPERREPPELPISGGWEKRGGLVLWTTLAVTTVLGLAPVEAGKLTVSNVRFTRG